MNELLMLVNTIGAQGSGQFLAYNQTNINGPRSTQRAIMVESLTYQPRICALAQLTFGLVTDSILVMSADILPCSATTDSRHFYTTGDPKAT